MYFTKCSLLGDPSRSQLRVHNIELFRKAKTLACSTTLFMITMRGYVQFKNVHNTLRTESTKAAMV